MKIRQKAPLLDLYPGPHRPVLLDSPELVFLNAVCAGLEDRAESVFAQGRLFSKDPVVIDTPYARYEGMDGVRAFMREWLPTFHASAAHVTPVFQTRSGGRSVSEVVVNFEVDGEINQVPMFVVGDLRTASSLEEIRMYCHATYVPGLTPYRKPMFVSAHLEMGDPGLLTGALREYYEALHHMPHLDVDRILASMGPGCIFGGYEPPHVIHEQSPEGLRQSYENMAKYIPHKVAMRYETIIDDGITGVIEWVHIISDAGRRDLNRVCLSGISAYERGEDGLLCSIRISDYAGYENQIDWTKTPLSHDEAYAINAVETFPYGCGRKPQS